MAIEIGVGYLSILPSTDKIAPGIKSALSDGEGEAERSGRRAGRRYSASFRTGIEGLRGPALAIGAAIGGLVGSSVKLEKQFSQTMSVAAATMGAPQAEMQKLQGLALKLGADTSFSANEAADAMLELAKGGLSAATIQAGALEGTLQLAAAGGTSLGTAAEIASNALNTFKIEGKDMAVVSAALAGGANASTASVESLGQALSQVGPGAVNAGLDIHETIGALAAFDSAGIKGSDAGTSLKTMLARLVPSTKKAATAMKDLGLDFTDAQGNFVPLTEVAQQLQDSLSGLSDSKRTQALNDIFGSDASRAASVLMTEGAEGIRNYIKATKDQGAAQAAADARMSGTAGALERLSGAWETFRLEIGLALAPTVVWLADALGNLTGVLSGNMNAVLIAGGVLAGFAAVILGLNVAFSVAATLVKAWGVATVVASNLVKGAAVAWRLLSLAFAASPIGFVVTLVAALVAGLVWFFTETKTGQAIVKTVWAAIKTAIAATVDWIVGTAWPALQTAWNAIADAAIWLYRNAIKPAFDFIVKVIQGAWIVIRLIAVSIATAFILMWRLISAVWSVTGKPVFDALVAAGKWLGESLARGFETVGLWFRILGYRLQIIYYKNILPVWRAMVSAAEIAWGWIDKHVIQPFMLGLRVLGLAFRIMWRSHIVPAWNGIKAAASATWSFIKARIFEPIKDGARAVGDMFRWLWRNAIVPAWNGIKAAGAAAWSWVQTRVFAPFRRGLDVMAKAFDIARKMIARAWDKIKAAAAKPINFVIETVYTKGIKATWDKVAKAVGLDLTLPAIKPLKFASGGVLPGYTPGRDVHHFTSPTGGRLSLSGGEAIMRPEFTRAVGGPAGVARLNAAARRGQAFASGGVWGWAGDAWQGVKNVASSVGRFLSDPVGSLTGLLKRPLDAVLGRVGGGSLGKIASQLPKKAVGALIDKAKGLVGGMTDLAGGGKPAGPALGWQNMWNVVKSAFPGATLNSAFRPGAITAVGTPSYHGQGRAIDVTPSMAIFNWIAKHFPNSRELIYSPAGGRQIWNGRNYMFGEPTRGDHWDHVHWAMKNGGVWSGLFDNGGWLPHKGVGVNMTGKPEAVLTPAESKALKAGVISATAEARRYVQDRTARRQRVVLQVGSREFEAFMREVAEDAVEADARYSDTVRRMR